MRRHLRSSEQERLQALLRQLRREAGLTQADVARALGRSQVIVSNYETGERRLDILELRQVCRVLGLSLEEFARRLEDVLGREEGEPEADMSR